MEDKTEEIVKQYPIHVNGKRRIRGAILFEAKEGIFTLIHCRESEKKLSFTEQIKMKLEEQGRREIDMALKTENGSYTTRDKQGNVWILKRWFLGRECNLHDNDDVREAVQNLACLHRELVYPAQDMIKDASKILTQEQEQEQEQTKTDCLEDFKQLGCKKEITGTLHRHMREMKRVYNYIRTKKQKNEMEICILNLFPLYYEQAGKALEQMDQESFLYLQQQSVDEGRLYHGSYNHHNILFTEHEIAVVNFERAEFGMQIVDLYHFLRKWMEKKGWSVHSGVKMIEEYQKIRPLSDIEAKMLYLLFLFPEKFWKQINFYYNGKKSWMSLKNYEKLRKMEEQEQERQRFLREIRGLLF